MGAGRVELWIGGGMVVNLGTRSALGLRNRPQTDFTVLNPGQNRQIDELTFKISATGTGCGKAALEAEFDIVYVYATHGYLLSEFLNPETNTA